MNILPCVVLNGPTASGKTAAAVRLAKLLIAAGRAAEIINADSMLVYKGMDIGTAKPTLVERGGVEHHLIDILEVWETASVSEFQQLARQQISDCRSRGVLPIVVGGSALYLRAIMDHFDFPATDPVVRAKWQARCAEIGAENLYRELVQLAPDAAAGILPQNARRIVRALEVIELTGSFTATLPKWEYALPGIYQYGIQLDNAELDLRIAKRVAQMWEAGFVAEVQGLLQRGLKEGMTAARGLGYRQIIEYLDGACSEAEAQENTIVGTRKFSRKQAAWFRRDQRILWFPAGENLAEDIFENLMSQAGEIIVPCK